MPSDNLPVPSALLGTQLDLLADDLPQASSYPSAHITQSDAQAVDLNVHNFNVAAICSLWKTVRTVDEACKLALTTAKVLRERRESLCLRHGAESSSHGRPSVLYPLD